MSSKVKLILTIAAAIVIITSIICVFVYISSLNKDIKDLNVLVNEQNNEIQSLHCQIDSLEKNVESMHETINIANDFISGLEAIHNNESAIKDEIYQEVINNEESQNWFNQGIPDGILSILLNNQNSTCIE